MQISSGNTKEDLWREFLSDKRSKVKGSYNLTLYIIYKAPM